MPSSPNPPACAQPLRYAGPQLGTGLQSSDPRPWSEASWMTKHHWHITVAHNFPPPPSIKIDNEAYVASIPPWLLGSVFPPAHTPPANTEQHKLCSAITQQHHSSEEHDMRKRSVTLLQRDANCGLPYAEAGQVSCDCQTKPPGRQKCKDQGQEKEIRCCRREVVPPAAPKHPWIKTGHVSHMHVSAGWRISWCWSKEHRSHMARTEGDHWATLSTMLQGFMKGLAWELFTQGFHGSYLLMAL